MRAYRLDECTNSKRLVKACAESGKAELRRFPRSKKGQGDAAVLQWLSRLETPLITTDTWMKVSHETDLPESHPGIIVIATGRPTPPTNKDKLRIINRFKSNFPEWDQMSLRNSIIEVWDGESFDLCVSRGNRGVVSQSVYLSFTDKQWKLALLKALMENAAEEPKN